MGPAADSQEKDGAGADEEETQFRGGLGFGGLGFSGTRRFERIFVRIFCVALNPKPQSELEGLGLGV